MEKKEGVSWKFYALLGTATVGLVGGLYYLYNLFSSNYEMEISEEQISKIEELTNLYQNISENSESSSQKANSEKHFTIKVFEQINEVSEEIFKKEYPNWISQRRQILKNSASGFASNSEYTSFCENILAEKMRIESTAAELILQKMGISQFDLQGMMEKIPQQDFMTLQENMIKKQGLSTDSVDVAKVSKDDIIRAFKSFMDKKKQLDEETKNFAQFMNDTSEEARMNFFLKLEIHKYMIDDFLLNTHGFDFNMLLQLLTDRKLTTDKEIKSDYDNLIYELRQSFQ